MFCPLFFVLSLLIKPLESPQSNRIQVSKLFIMGLFLILIISFSVILIVCHLHPGLFYLFFMKLCKVSEAHLSKAHRRVFSIAITFQETITKIEL